MWKLARTPGSPRCVPGTVPSAFHTLNQGPLPGTLGGHCNPHCSAQDPALESPYKGQGRRGCTGRRPTFSRREEARTLPGGICLGYQFGGFLLPQIPSSWKKQRRAGSSVEPRPAPPTGSRRKSARLSRAPSEPGGGGVGVWGGPTRPSPPSLLLELKAAGAENQPPAAHPGTRRGKTPAAAA